MSSSKSVEELTEENTVLKNYIKTLEDELAYYKSKSFVKYFQSPKQKIFYTDQEAFPPKQKLFYSDPQKVRSLRNDTLRDFGNIFKPRGEFSTFRQFK